jgi:uncharacterized protein (DUF1697 family)
MAVLISMLRGVNVGGHNQVKMDALKALYASLGFTDAQTYVQSGNVVFKTSERDLAAIALRIRDGIEKSFGFRTDVILRTSTQLRDAIAKNPFAKMKGVDSSKLLVTFLAAQPAPKVSNAALQMKLGPEELRIGGRELYIYFPNGMGRSKLSWMAIVKALGTTGTGRNINSVMKLLEIAETLETSL